MDARRLRGRRPCGALHARGPAPGPGGAGDARGDPRRADAYDSCRHPWVGRSCLWICSCCTDDAWRHSAWHALWCATIAGVRGISDCRCGEGGREGRVGGRTGGAEAGGAEAGGDRRPTEAKRRALGLEVRAEEEEGQGAGGGYGGGQGGSRQGGGQTCGSQRQDGHVLRRVEGHEGSAGDCFSLRSRWPCGLVCSSTRLRGEAPRILFCQTIAQL
mmetsp:Transcript_51892/g.168699  ORF Transcript_51892/g.168699 Transcript_51892/m.168699 type:complete len:216 (-) Transcript_51892:17-664(-)